LGGIVVKIINTIRTPIIERRRPNSNYYGFTLLEIIIIMLIVGMMATIIAPAVRSGIDSLHFRTSIKQLMAILRYCRSKAISTKKEKTVEIDLDEGIYKIVGDVLPEDGEDKKSSLMGSLPEGAIFTEWETPYESETTDIQTITFYPKGNASGGILRIEDKKGKPLEITIDRITGRAKVVNLYD
jgi:general secretion pathway protein H